jgi:hypothetical protein
MEGDHMLKFSKLPKDNATPAQAEAAFKARFSNEPEAKAYIKSNKLGPRWTPAYIERNKEWQLGRHL